MHHPNGHPPFLGLLKKLVYLDEVVQRSTGFSGQWNIPEQSDGQSGRPDWWNILETSVLEVNKSGLVFSGSLPPSGNIYIKFKPALLIKILKSSMIFSMSVLNALSLSDGRVI